MASGSRSLSTAAPWLPPITRTRAAPALGRVGARREARAERHAVAPHRGGAEGRRRLLPRQERAPREGRQNSVRETDGAVRFEHGHRDAEEGGGERRGAGRVAADAENGARAQSPDDPAPRAASRAARRARRGRLARRRRPSSARRRGSSSLQPRAGTTRASTPRAVPTNTTSTSARPWTASATATAGKTWPPVPPPAMRSVGRLTRRSLDVLEVLGQGARPRTRCRGTFRRDAATTGAPAEGLAGPPWPALGRLRWCSARC